MEIFNFFFPNINGSGIKYINKTNMVTRGPWEYYETSLRVIGDNISQDLLDVL